MRLEAVEAGRGSRRGTGKREFPYGETTGRQGAHTVQGMREDQLRWFRRYSLMEQGGTARQESWGGESDTTMAHFLTS